MAHASPAPTGHKWRPILWGLLSTAIVAASAYIGFVFYDLLAFGLGRDWQDEPTYAAIGAVIAVALSVVGLVALFVMLKKGIHRKMSVPPWAFAVIVAVVACGALWQIFFLVDMVISPESWIRR